MTDEERRNRNPAVEIEKVKVEEFEAKHPVVRADELRRNLVYVLQSELYIATMNYVGGALSHNLLTGQKLTVHQFYGPRAEASVIVRANPDGTFADLTGMPITVRRWMGEDA